MVRRGQPELANQTMMEWAHYLKLECHKFSCPIIDNTLLTPETTLQRIASLIEKKL